jgi:uncharacterized protein YbcI
VAKRGGKGVGLNSGHPDGEALAVEAFRRTFQATMEEHFSEVVEAATGKRVRAYMSQVHVSPDVAIEVFMLEPEE